MRDGRTYLLVVTEPSPGGRLGALGRLRGGASPRGSPQPSPPRHRQRRLVGQDVLDDDDGPGRVLRRLGQLPPGRSRRLLVEVRVAQLPLQRPRGREGILLRAGLPDLPQAALGPRGGLRRQYVLHGDRLGVQVRGQHAAKRQLAGRGLRELPAGARRRQGQSRLRLSHEGGGVPGLAVVHVELVLVRRSHAGRHARRHSVVRRRRHLRPVRIHSPGVGLAVNVAVDRLERVREALRRESETGAQ